LIGEIDAIDEGGKQEALIGSAAKKKAARALCHDVRVPAEAKTRLARGRSSEINFDDFAKVVCVIATLIQPKQRAR